MPIDLPMNLTKKGMRKIQKHYTIKKILTFRVEDVYSVEEVLWSVPKN